MESSCDDENPTHCAALDRPEPQGRRQSPQSRSASSAPALVSVNPEHSDELTVGAAASSLDHSPLLHMTTGRGSGVPGHLSAQYPNPPVSRRLAPLTRPGCSPSALPPPGLGQTSSASPFPPTYWAWPLTHQAVQTPLLLAGWLSPCLQGLPCCCLWSGGPASSLPLLLHSFFPPWGLWGGCQGPGMGSQT